MNGTANIPKRLLIAVGGNAIHPAGIKGTSEEQMDIAALTARTLLPVLELDNELIITHGNGPGVGKMLMRQAMARERVAPMSLDICVADTQGATAYILGQAFENALREKGNRVISIQGARTRELLFWQEKLAAVSDEHIVTTDDGSFGRKGLVTEPLKELLEQDGEKKIGCVYAIGPAIMMKFCSLTTLPFKVPTIVSLNSIFFVPVVFLTSEAKSRRMCPI